MTVTFFEMLAPVIDRNVSSISKRLGLSVSDVYERVVVEANRNQAEWYSGAVPNLNYQNDDCRLAYLYIVAAANANTFKYVLKDSDDLRAYVLDLARSRRQIKVCALGAGPGTELLAMAKFFDEQQLGCCVKVDFQLLDRVQEWANSWYGIRDAVHATFCSTYGNDFGKWPVIPSGNFLQCDVTDLTRLSYMGDVWDQDIYVINFLLSEIFNDDPGLRAFLKEVAGTAPTGSRFVFIERRGSMWARRMAAIAKEAGLVLSPFAESRSECLDADEKPENLGAIFAAIGLRKTPRMSWKVVYSIGTKV